MAPRAARFALFAARFSFMVFSGAFLVCFLRSMPLLIALLLDRRDHDIARKTDESPVKMTHTPSGLE